MSNEGIVLEIFHHKTMASLGHLRMRQEPKYLAELKGVGAGSFQINLNAKEAKNKATLLHNRNVVKMRVNNNIVGAWLINADATKMISQNEQGDEVIQISGEGLKKWFDDSIVLPEGGIKTGSKDVRAFSFASKGGIWYKSSEWQNITVMGRVRSSQPWKNAPAKWPTDALKARWIWSAVGNTAIVGAGTSYFRLTMPLTANGKFRIHIAADSYYTFYIDGEEVAKSDPSNPGWKEANTLTVELTPGTHVLGFKVTNLIKSAGLAVAIYRMYPPVAESRVGDVTFNIATSRATSTAHGLNTYDKVMFKTTGSLPGGLEPDKTYYLRDRTTNTFGVSKSKEGPIVQFSGTQSGSHGLYIPAIPETARLIHYSGMSVSELTTIRNQKQSTVNTRQSTYDALPAGDSSGTKTQRTQAKKKSDALSALKKANQDLAAAELELSRAQATNADMVWKCQNEPAVAPGWTPGEILLTLLSESAARGVVSAGIIQPNFTANADSYGNPWGSSSDWEFDISESLGSVVSKLEELACDIWITSGTYQLNVVNTRGIDRSQYGLGNAVVYGTNQIPTPAPTAFAGSGWQTAPSTVTVPGGWVDCLFTTAQTPYIFTGLSKKSYAIGDLVTLAVSYRVDAVPAGGAVTHVTVRPHIRTGNTYITAAAQLRPIVIGQEERVVIQWVTDRAIAVDQLDIALVGANSAGGLTSAAIGFQWRAGKPIIEDGATDGVYYDGSTVSTDPKIVYAWTAAVNASPSTVARRAVTSTPILFQRGKNVIEGAIQSKGNIVNQVVVKTASGWLSTMPQDAASIAEYGVIEGSMDTGVSDSLAKKMVDRAFLLQSQTEEGATYDIWFPPTGIVPFIDFNVGDLVIAPDKNGLDVPRRVVSISVAEGDQGEALYAVEFDVIFYPKTIAQAKKLKKLTSIQGLNSAFNAKGTSSSSPTSPVVMLNSGALPNYDLIPIPPEDLSAFTIGTWSADGVTATSQLNLIWSPVTENTDGSEMIPVSYEVWGRNVDESEDAYAQWAVVTEPKAVIDGFFPGSKWSFKVLANGASEPSEFSVPLEVIFDGPVEPMAPPTAPVLTSSRGVLMVAWDGTLAGNAPPPQFRYVYAEVSNASAGPYVKMGPVFNRDTRSIPISGLGVGTTPWVRLVAIDGVGIPSAPSTAVSHTITGVNLGDLDTALQTNLAVVAEASKAAREQLNMLNDYSFELNTQEFWLLNAATVNQTVNPRIGARSLKITTTAAAFEAFRYQRAIPCDPDDTFYFRFFMRAGDAASALVNDGLVIKVLYGPNESTTLSLNIGPSDQISSSAYVSVSATWTAPAGTYFFRPALQCVHTTAGRIFYIDDARLLKMTGPTDIVAASVTADKIAADSIVAEHIRSENVATRHLQAESITGEKIQAKAITAREIAANAITANEIAAGTITATELKADIGGDLDISANSSIELIVGPGGLIPGLEDSVTGVSDNLELMQTYYNFGADGAVISKPGSVYAIAIRNDKIEMLENGNPVSYWNSGQLYVTQFVGEIVTLGNHQLEKFGTGTVVRAIGT